VITLFFFITNPIASHIIARFAWLSEIVPWKKTYADRLRIGEEREDD
jgi:multisubunit Na+/H+ antiporter MnhG subunit